VPHFKTKAFRDRAEAATALCRAIGECHHEDAVVVLEGALEQLRVGYPTPYFLRLREEAEWWASNATRAELKAFVWAAFHAMANRDRTAFLQAISRAVVA
jgi:hypothetical protein